MQKTDEIAEAYKRAFGQDSVLRANTGGLRILLRRLMTTATPLSVLS